MPLYAKVCKKKKEPKPFEWLKERPINAEGENGYKILTQFKTYELNENSAESRNKVVDNTYAEAEFPEVTCQSIDTQSCHSNASIEMSKSLYSLGMASSMPRSVAIKISLCWLFNNRRIIE